MVKRLAVIPARGGSKRLPRKNLVDFFGKPLMAWTIEAALASQLFDRVVVSTEDNDIAAAGRKFGADVPFLRAAYFDDHANVSDVTVHALRQFEEILGETFDVVAMLQPTCPLRDSSDIKAGIRAFETSGADFHMSCFRFPWMNPWWSFRRDEQGRADWLFPEMLGRRSQDQEPTFGLTGAIAIANAAALLQTGTLYGPDQRFEPISWVSAIDIDDEQDLAFARAAYLMKRDQA